MKKFLFFPLVLFLVSIFFYPYLPDQVPSHWNAAGEVDGHMPKPLGAFLVPVMLLGLVLLFLALPKIDPLKRNYKAFSKYYAYFIIVLCAFMFLIQMIILLWSVGYKISPNLVMPIAIGLLFVSIGLILPHLKKNWFMGIRTPWTLSSDEVWEKTHKFAGKLFIVAGIICITGLFFDKYAYLLILLPAIAVALASVIYSYIISLK